MREVPDWGCTWRFVDTDADDRGGDDETQHDK